MRCGWSDGSNTSAKLALGVGMDAGSTAAKCDCRMSWWVCTSKWWQLAKRGSARASSVERVFVLRFEMWLWGLWSSQHNAADNSGCRMVFCKLNRLAVSYQPECALTQSHAYIHANARKCIRSVCADNILFANEKATHTDTPRTDGDN